MSTPIETDQTRRESERPASHSGTDVAVLIVSILLLVVGAATLFGAKPIMSVGLTLLAIAISAVRINWKIR